MKGRNYGGGGLEKEAETRMRETLQGAETRRRRRLELEEKGN